MVLAETGVIVNLLLFFLKEYLPLVRGEWQFCQEMCPESGRQSPVRYLRVVSESQTGEVLVLRELDVFN